MLFTVLSFWSSKICSVIVSHHKDPLLAHISLKLFYIAVVTSVTAWFPSCSQKGKNFLRSTDLFPDQSECKISNNVIRLANFSSILTSPQRWKNLQNSTIIVWQIGLKWSKIFVNNRIFMRQPPLNSLSSYVHAIRWPRSSIDFVTLCNNQINALACHSRQLGQWICSSK